MPIATKTKTSLLSDEFKNQIANNLSIDTTPVEQQKTVVTPQVATPEPKSKYNDVANLHFSRGKKAEFKAFFHAAAAVRAIAVHIRFLRPLPGVFLLPGRLF